MLKVVKSLDFPSEIEIILSHSCGSELNFEQNLQHIASTGCDRLIKLAKII
jgi:hypothetical protein